jgi:hypothetical protein
VTSLRRGERTSEDEALEPGRLHGPAIDRPGPGEPRK